MINLGEEKELHQIVKALYRVLQRDWLVRAYSMEKDRGGVGEGCYVL